jgi:hypothetical protein
MRRAEFYFAAITKDLEATIKVNFDFNRKTSAFKVCGEAYNEFLTC